MDDLNHAHHSLFRHLANNNNNVGNATSDGATSRAAGSNNVHNWASAVPATTDQFGNVTNHHPPTLNHQHHPHHLNHVVVNHPHHPHPHHPNQFAAGSQLHDGPGVINTPNNAVVAEELGVVGVGDAGGINHHHHPHFITQNHNRNINANMAAMAAPAGMQQTHDHDHHHRGGGVGFGGMGAAASTIMTSPIPPTITANLTRRQRRRRQQPKQQPKQQQPQILYHAIRPDGVLLQEPVIFFGLQDFQQYANYIMHHQQQQAHRYGGGFHNNNNNNGQLVYRVFDSLADAFAYVQGEEVMPTTTKDASDVQEQQQASHDLDDETDNNNEARKQPALPTINWQGHGEGTNAPDTSKKSNGGNANTASRASDNSSATPTKAAAKTNTTTGQKQPQETITEGQDEEDKDTEQVVVVKAGHTQRVTKAWEAKFALLRQYKAEFGDCHVPTDKRHPKIQNQYRPLSKWIQKQRTALSKYDRDPIQHPLKIMTLEQRQRLMNLGFVQNFNILETNNTDNDGTINLPRRMALQRKFNNNFEQRIEELKAFKAKHGHLNVPSSNGRLHGWLRRIHDQYRLLEAEKNNRNKIKVGKDGKTNEQGDNNNQTTTTTADNSSDNAITATTPGLAKRETCLQLEHLVALTSLGWSFQGSSSSNLFSTRKPLKDRIQDYVAFVKRTCSFPSYRSPNEEERKLGFAAQRWKKLRLQQDRGEAIAGNKQVLTDELIAELDAVGFSWEFKEIPAVKRQKRAAAAAEVMQESSVQDTTTPKRPRRSATPDPKIDSLPWEAKYELLKAYKEKHGHCEPPVKHRKLGKFVRTERHQFKLMKEGWRKSTMTLDRYRKLSELGFRFEARPRTGAHPRLRGWGSSGYDTTSSEEGGGQKRARHEEKRKPSQANEEVGGAEDNTKNFTEVNAHVETGAANDKLTIDSWEVV